MAVIDKKAAGEVEASDDPTSSESFEREGATSSAPSEPEEEASALGRPSAAPNEDSSTAEEPIDEIAWVVGRDDANAVKAELWPDGTFVLDGSGATVSFAEIEEADGSQAIAAPWLAEGYADRITRVVFAEAVQPESLAYWFDGCANLRSVSEIPASVKDLTCAFRDCRQLDEAPELPAGTELLDSTFKGCAALEVAPSIPASVERAVSTFEGCTLLAALPTFDGVPAVMDRMFFDCPAIVDLADAFTFGISSKACFGFAEQPADLVATSYAGYDGAVLAYDWVADGRELAIPDASEAMDPPAETDQSERFGDEETLVAEEGSAIVGSGSENLSAAEARTKQGFQVADESAKSDAGSSATLKQVSITVPSSVPLLLNPDGQGASTIPVSVANRSDTAVRIVGVRLKRSDVDIPGGSWSLVSQETGTHFVDGARFTPGGKEAVLTTPVELAADSAERLFAWEGSFTSFEMKNLIRMATDASDSFTYGTMVWHIEAV